MTERDTRFVYSTVPDLPPSAAVHRRRAFALAGRRLLLRTLVGGVLALSAIGSLASPVAAHAELASSEPAANVALVDGPAQLELVFTEPVDPATAVVELLDAQQNSVGGLSAVQIGADGMVATVLVPELEPGAYTVSFLVVSAVDGHATAGLYAFLVDPAGTEAPPAAAPTSTSPSVDPAAVAARWIALAAIIVALGSLIMWWNAGRHGRPPWLLIAVASCLAFIGLAVYLALASRPIIAALEGGHGGHGGAGFPFDFAAAFGWTPFAIAMRVAVAGSLAAFVVSLARYFSLQGRPMAPGDDRGRALLAGILLGVGMAGMSMAGHAAATGGPAFGAVDWLHLASVAAWLGGLPAALILARRAGPDRGVALRSILRRHARLALVAGPITALTGLANTPLVLGTSRDLVASDYGNLLIVKVLLIGVALGMGAINHLALRAVRPGRVGTLIGIDLVVALLAVLVGATMVTIQPSAGRQPVLVTTAQAPAHLYGSAGPSSVHAAISLPAPGRQTYQVTLIGEDGASPSDVQKVFLTFAPPSAALPSERVELSPGARPGLYGTSGAYTPIEGTWDLEVTVRRAGAIDESVAFELPVSAPDPPELTPPPDTGVDVPAPLALLWGFLPKGPAAWLPAVIAALLVGATAWWSRRSAPSGLLSTVRLAVLALLAVAVIGAGSRALVSAANAVPEGALEANPVDATTDSVALGERLYRANCASCHGPDGNGDGPVVAMPAPRPLRAIVHFAADGELSHRIAVGVAGTSMPAFAGIISPEDRWHLINYLRDRFSGS